MTNENEKLVDGLKRRTECNIAKDEDSKSSREDFVIEFDFDGCTVGHLLDLLNRSQSLTVSTQAKIRADWKKGRKLYKKGEVVKIKVSEETGTKTTTILMTGDEIYAAAMDPQHPRHEYAAKLIADVMKRAEKK